MKKTSILGLCILLILSVCGLAGCGNKDDGTVGGLLHESREQFNTPAATGQARTGNNEMGRTWGDTVSPTIDATFSYGTSDKTESSYDDAYDEVLDPADIEKSVLDESSDDAISSSRLTETKSGEKPLEKTLHNPDGSITVYDYYQNENVTLYPNGEVKNDPQFSPGSVEKENQTYREKKMNKLLQFPLCPDDGIMVLDVNQNAYLSESDVILLALSGQYYDADTFEWEGFEENGEYSVAHVRAEYCTWTDEPLNVYFYVNNAEGTIPKMIVLGTKSGELYELSLDTSFGSRIK